MWSCWWFYMRQEWKLRSWSEGDHMLMFLTRVTYMTFSKLHWAWHIFTFAGPTMMRKWYKCNAFLLTKTSKTTTPPVLGVSPLASSSSCNGYTFSVTCASLKKCASSSRLFRKFSETSCISSCYSSSSYLQCTISCSSRTKWSQEKEEKMTTEGCFSHTTGFFSLPTSLRKLRYTIA